MGMKFFVVPLSFVFFVFLSSAVLTTTASADNRMTGIGNCSGGVCTDKGSIAKGTPCPAGTCSKIGTPYAKDIKYCSAANCRK
jgi:hypothetical protein